MIFFTRERKNKQKKCRPQINQNISIDRRHKRQWFDQRRKSQHPENIEDIGTDDIANSNISIPSVGGHR